MVAEAQTQQQFLQAAMDELDLGRKEFAERIGCPWTTLKKWLALPDATANYREMPNIAWSLVREVLEHERLKRYVEKLEKTASNV